MHIAIIGGGPAGLRAAEVAAEAGAEVTLFESKASVGRKFLVAGRGGLNLTHLEPREPFIARYSGPPERWTSLLADFDATALQAWAAGLGVETFAASTGRVYPRSLKSAPLLRRWVERLRHLGVRMAMHHCWQDLARLDGGRRLHFTVSGEARDVTADAVILALGGASWPETGSDGAWKEILRAHGVAVAPLQPANCGWEIPWPEDVLTVAEGQPLKSIRVRAGTAEVSGELMVTRYGLEGGAIYQLGPALRGLAAPQVSIDFKPQVAVEQLVAKMGPIRRNFIAESQARWRLSPAAHAILAWRATQEPIATAEDMARVAKACVIPLTGPRPMAEAISSAGGVAWSELDDTLMLNRLRGVFLAGEMIDWEAPTGGYLLQGCFATGTRAARGAVAEKTL